MKTWDVKIRATVIKTIRVDAETEEEAINDAHSNFTVASNDGDEDYDEAMESCVEVN